MSTPLDIAIIIVSWNVREQLIACLSSLRALPAHEQPNTIWVVDNASTDGTVAAVRAQFPEVRLLAQATNLGFAAANNLALQQVTEAFSLLLNPDTLVSGGCIPALLAAADTHPQAGILGPKLLNPDGTWQPSVRRLPSATTLIAIALKVTHWWPSFPALRKYMCNNFQKDVMQQVQQVMGAAFLIRREVYMRLGGMDEKFYLWFEEVDYCARALAAGWEIWYVPQATVTHLGGESFGQVANVQKQRQWLTSSFHFSRKYHTQGEQILVYLAGHLGLLLTRIFMLGKGSRQ